MITARAFAGKHYAVYGLARSGLATVEALLASGARVTAWDASEEARAQLSSLRGKASWGGGPSAEERVVEGPDAGAMAPPPSFGRFPSPPLRGREDLEIANLDEVSLDQFDSLVVTPGLPLNRHPIAARAREAGVEIVGDIELFARARPELPPHKVVGITGTNGKSTTTALVHHILKTAGVPATMGGNIGLPILAQDPLSEGGVYVLELSSYQIDLTRSLDCDVAVLLNITPDHLDRYDSFEAYVASKLRLFGMQRVSHGAVVGPHRELWEALIRAGELRRRGQPNDWPHFIEPANQLRWDLGGAPDRSPALAGPHNEENLLAAAVAVAGIVNKKEVLEGLRTFPGLPHRMERVGEKDGILFVNDSKATNPTATAPALAAFPSIRWICGGQAKGDNLDECAPHFGNVRSAYTIGEAGDLFERLLAPHMPVTNCETLENAVNRAAEDSQAGDTVLLSPACASFDQFRDFEERGNRFKALVGGL